MNPNRRNTLRALQRAVFFAGLGAVAIADPAYAFPFGHDAVSRPAAREFGFGPRESAKQKYTVYMRPSEPLRLRKLQNVRVLVLDATGRPVRAEQATALVDAEVLDLHRHHGGSDGDGVDAAFARCHGRPPRPGIIQCCP